MLGIHGNSPVRARDQSVSFRECEYILSRTKKQRPNRGAFYSELAREMNMTLEKVVEAKDELELVEMGALDLAEKKRKSFRILLSTPRKTNIGMCHCFSFSKRCWIDSHRKVIYVKSDLKHQLL